MIRTLVTSARKLLLMCSVVACLGLFSLPAFSQDDDPPAQAGRLSLVNGTVSIQPAGAQDWGQAYLNYPLGPGDRIYTDADGRAEIEVGQTYLRIGPHTDVTFVDFNPQAITFGAAQGALHIRTRGLWDGQSLYVQTPSGSTTVTGPADFRVDVYPDEQTAVFTNFNGDVYVSGANDLGMDTGAGQSLELVGTNPVYPQWLQPAAPDDLDNWSRRRDVQIERAASYHYVSPDAPGAEDLDGYGEWTPGTEYGDMWFPQVPVGWQPYHNGHWVNREPWGWVWVEDEPWGYAPFHYGRWIVYRGRWGWVPGPREMHPVWSPALVVFAGGVGGGGDSAWFPLGPGEAYRPWYPCSPRYVDRVNITNIRETNVVHVQKTYVNIVNVTNVTNITYVNRSVGVTAMHQQDFAAGRSVAQSAVHVDPQQMQRVQVLARPQAVPTHTAVIGAPPARAVPVVASRPVMINAKGMAVAAQPRAQSAPPPQRQTPTPPSLPDRAVVAPPPNVKMTPAARQAMETAPRPAQPPMGNRPGQPAAPPSAGRPVSPNAPADRPAPIPANPPRPTPIPTPGTRSQAQPETPPPPPRPAPPQQERPAPPPQERPAPPEQRPAPPQRPQYQPPAPPARPQDRPAPYQQPAPPPRQQEPPAPHAQPAPPPRQEERPAPPPPPQPRPEARPEPPPPHTTPPPPPPRQNSEPAPRPAPRQQPPPPEKKKPDEKDKRPDK